MRKAAKRRVSPSIKVGSINPYELPNSDRRRIETFESLRFLGMIIIFLNRTWAYLPFKIPDFGARGTGYRFCRSCG